MEAPAVLTAPKFRSVKEAVRYMLSHGVTFERVGPDDVVFFADPACSIAHVRQVMADWKAPILSVLREASIPNDEGAGV
jgi:hypothetical protein